jgi:FkbH-like protein
VTLVKCVVWDLDGTLWPGVAIESLDAGLPEPFPAALAALATLEERGIVNSVASRTDPSLRALLLADPRLGRRFVTPQLSWGDKSEAIRTVAAELGIATGAVAFVDDNPFERAEVAAMLPEVLVLAPEELYARLESSTFRPDVVTADAQQRVRRYRDEQRRRTAEQGFAGAREDFLRASRIRLALRPAAPADLDRLAELVERTHRLNTTGEPWPADRLAPLLDSPEWTVTLAALTDRYGDYGTIGAAIVQHTAPEWRLRLFSVSCRVAGRDVPVGLLGWLLDRARAAGAAQVTVDLRPAEANLELRILLRGAGFDVATDEPDAAGLITLARPTSPALPPVPWLTIEPTEEATP